MSVEGLKYSEITGLILEKFFETYNKFGYGFNKEIYKNALGSILRQTGNIKIEKNKLVDVYYEIDVVGKFEVDYVIEDKVLIHITSDDTLQENEILRLFNYLRASKYEVGLILNFGIKPEYKRREIIERK